MEEVIGQYRELSIERVRTMPYVVELDPVTAADPRLPEIHAFMEANIRQEWHWVHDYLDKPKARDLRLFVGFVDGNEAMMFKLRFG